MAESSTPTETSDTSSEDISHPADGAQSPTISAHGNAANGASTQTSGAESDGAPPSPPRRKVYESTLIPDRQRRHVPSWILLIVLIAIVGSLAYFVYGSHGRRSVKTAGKMVYAAADTPGAASKVWISNVDGTKAQALSTAAGGDDSPVFSPDGNQVAFVSTRQGGDRQIFVMDADGQNVQQVTRNSGSKSMPAFAPAGGDQLIAYTSGGILFKTDIGAGDTDRLLPPAPKDDKGAPQSDTDTSQSENLMTVTQFAWAPGAKKREEQALAASVDAGAGTGHDQMLALFSSVEKDPTIIKSPQDGLPVRAASITVGWSPDGGLLAAALLGGVLPHHSDPSPVAGRKTPVDEFGSSIELYTSAGEPTQKVVIPLAYFQGLGGKGLRGPEHPLFSPDGEQVVYELWDQPDLASRHCVGLYKVPVAGDAPPQAIVQGDAEKAQFTPDGQSLLYLVKRADGGHDLCQVGVDGSNPHRLSDGKQDVTDFSVSPQRG